MRAHDTELEQEQALQDCLTALEAGRGIDAALASGGVAASDAGEMAALLAVAEDLRGLPLPGLPQADLLAIEADLMNRAGRPGRTAWEAVRPWLIAGLALGLLGLAGLALRGRSAREAEVLDPPAVPTAIRAEALAAPPPSPRPAADAKAAAPGASQADLLAILAAELQATARARPAATPSPRPSLGAASTAVTALAGPPSASATPTAAASPPAVATKSRPRDRQTPVLPSPTALHLLTPSPEPSLTPSPPDPATDTPVPSPSVPPTELPVQTPEPTREPEAMAVLEVILRDAESGEPLAEAEVLAQRVDGGPSVAGRTGAMGGARLELAGNVAYHVVGEAAGHRSRWWPDASTRADAEEIVVAPGARREIGIRLPLRTLAADRAPAPRR